MRFTGRIIVLLLFLVWVSIDSIVANKILIVHFVLAVPLALFLGKQYDQSKYFAKQLQHTKKALKEKLNNEIQESEERYRHIVEKSQDMIAVHQNGILLFINTSGIKLLGAQTMEDVIGKSILDFVPLTILEKAKKELASSYLYLEKNGLEFQIVGLDGVVTDVAMTSTPTSYKGAPARQIIARNISDRNELARLVEQMAYYDSLTGFPNRNNLNVLVKQRLIEAEANKTQLAIMFIDLDRFKLVNDTYCHHTGDTLLKKIANRLVTCVRKDDIVSRLGGDEFIICLLDS